MKSADVGSVIKRLASMHTVGGGGMTMKQAENCCSIYNVDWAWLLTVCKIIVSIEEMSKSNDDLIAKTKYTTDGTDNN